MSRWDTKLKREVDLPAVDAFLAEVIEVCRKHGMTILHEDGQGTFIISTAFDAEEVGWLLAAHVHQR